MPCLGEVQQGQALRIEIISLTIGGYEMVAESPIKGKATLNTESPAQSLCNVPVFCTSS